MFRTGLKPGMWLSGVRFKKRPEPTCVNHTSSGPSRSEINVTNLPSGDSAASASSPSKLVSRVNVAFDSGLSGGGLRRATPHPARPDASAVTAIGAHRRHDEGTAATAGPSIVTGALPPA